MDLISTPLLAASTGGTEKLSLAIVVLELALVYLTALLGGEFCRRLGFPSLLGELLGGLLIGISGLHLFVPDPALPPDSSVLVNWVAGLHGGLDSLAEVFAFQGEFFRNLANVGVVVLLFEIGLGANLNQFLVQRSKVIAVAGTGVLLSIVGGSLVLNAFFGVEILPALFMGAALSVTSLGVTLQLLRQEAAYTPDETQVVIGAAMLDDVIGIILLSLILGVFKTGGSVMSLNILLVVVLTTAVIVVAILAGRLFSRLLMLLRQILTTPGRVIIPALMFAFVFVLIASGAGLVNILGAFLAGLVLKGGVRRLIAESLRPVVDAFVPIFFVYVGAETDLSQLLPGAGDRGWFSPILALFLIAISVVSKLASGYAVSIQEGMNPLAIGLGMIPRGEVMLVFAEVGRIAGILDPILFTVLVVVSLTSALAASLGLRWLKPAPIRIPVGESR
ncbi:cation:proton antiporter [Synechococcus sp. PCC 7336]|uniref:cation:proton antiporter n=1 Tax=Synechococcus sp. PCC 7336 TaxID=195250 RepID=UPI00034B0E86|nr:cation:proton antiporter [Synechococcus sp. PCC 7336]